MERNLKPQLDQMASLRTPFTADWLCIIRTALLLLLVSKAIRRGENREGDKKQLGIREQNDIRAAGFSTPRGRGDVQLTVSEIGKKHQQLAAANES